MNMKLCLLWTSYQIGPHLCYLQMVKKKLLAYATFQISTPRWPNAISRVMSHQGFSYVIINFPKLCFPARSIITFISQQTFAHAPTAQLLVHVQNLVMIRHMKLELIHTEIFRISRVKSLCDKDQTNFLAWQLWGLSWHCHPGTTLNWHRKGNFARNSCAHFWFL